MRTFYLLLKRELFLIWHDRGIRIILFVIPFLTLLLFWGIYQPGTLFHIPAAIVDLDQSANSRMVISEFESSENLDIKAYYQTFEELKEAIENGEVITGVVIPKDFGKNLELRRSTRMLMVIDGTNMAYATNASTTMMEIAETLKATTGVKTLLAYRPTTDDDLYSSVGNLTDGEDVTLSDTTDSSSSSTSTGSLELDMNLYDAGYTMAEALQVYMPITFQDEGWFNPTLNYSYFVLLGVFFNIWQQCSTLLFCMNILGETGTPSWLQIKTSGFSKIKLFAGKSVLQILLVMLVAAVILFISFVLCKLPTSVSIFVWLGFLLCFTLALHGLGTMMSSVTANSLDATRLGMVVALPSFLISGFSWPLEEMPLLLQKIAWCIPQTWFFQGINYLSFKNPPAGFIGHYCLVLLLMALLFYAVGFCATYVRERM